MSVRLGWTLHSLVLAAVTAIAGCGGEAGGLVRTSSSSTCIPAPLPTPGAMLISPASNATGVSPGIGSVTFQIYTNTNSGTVDATVLAVSLVPTGGVTLSATQINALGTPSPAPTVRGPPHPCKDSDSQSSWSAPSFYPASAWAKNTSTRICLILERLRRISRDSDGCRDTTKSIRIACSACSRPRTCHTQ